MPGFGPVGSFPVGSLPAAGGNTDYDVPGANLALSGFAAGLIEDLVLTPPHADLTLSGAAPSLGDAYEPAAADLVLLPSAPGLTSVLTPPQADLVLASIAAGLDLAITPLQGDLVLEGAAPTTGDIIVVPQGDLLLSGDIFTSTAWINVDCLAISETWAEVPVD